MAFMNRHCWKTSKAPRKDGILSLFSPIGKIQRKKYFPIPLLLFALVVSRSLVFYLVLLIAYYRAYASSGETFGLISPLQEGLRGEGGGNDDDTEENILEDSTAYKELMPSTRWLASRLKFIPALPVTGIKEITFFGLQVTKHMENGPTTTKKAGDILCDGINFSSFERFWNQHVQANPGVVDLRMKTAEQLKRHWTESHKSFLNMRGTMAIIAGSDSAFNQSLISSSTGDHTITFLQPGSSSSTARRPPATSSSSSSSSTLPPPQQSLAPAPTTASTTAPPSSPPSLGELQHHDSSTLHDDAGGGSKKTRAPPSCPRCGHLKRAFPDYHPQRRTMDDGLVPCSNPVPLGSSMKYEKGKCCHNLCEPCQAFLEKPRKRSRTT